MLRVFIDNKLLDDQPQGLDSLKFSINLDFENRTLMKSTENELNFVGDGYDTLYKSFLANGYEGEHTVKIEKSSNGNWFRIWEGFLFVSDVTLDLNKHIATTKIQDAAYWSLINNNYKVEMVFGYGQTKNGLESDNIATAVIIDMFDPPSKTITGARNVYNLISVFKSLTSFVSDNRVEFQSDYLTNLEDNDDIAYGLTNGWGLRQTSTFNGKTNFEDLVIDIGRAHDLLLSVDESTGTPILRLESLDYYSNSEVAVVCSDVKDIKRSYYQELLYSTLQVGSAETDPREPAVGSLSYHPPFSFADENYFLEGKSNINSEKDIRFNTFIVDSNIIEDVYVNNNDDKDEKLFIIEYEKSTLIAKRSKILGNLIAGNYYNGSLTNNEIIRRHPWQGGQKALLGSANEEVDALSTDNVVTTNDVLLWEFETAPLKFADDFYDPGAHYDPGTGRYVASADGTKNISLNLGWLLPLDLQGFSGLIQSNSSGHLQDLGYLWIKTFLNVNIYDSVGTLKSTHQNTPTFRPATDCLDYGHHLDVVQEEGFYTIYLDATDYFEVTATYQRRVVATSFVQGADPFGIEATDTFMQPVVPITNAMANVTIQDNNSLKVLVGTNLGGQVLGELNLNYRVNRWEFSSDMTDEEIIDLLVTPYKAIQLINTKENINLKTWVKSVDISPLTNNTDFETVNSLENI